MKKILKNIVLISFYIKIGNILKYTQREVAYVEYDNKSFEHGG